MGGKYVAVGANGLVLYCNAACDTTAATWTVASISGVTAQLQGVSRTNGMVYVVGAANTAYVLNGASGSRNDAGNPISITYNLTTTDLTDLQDINATPTPYVTGTLPASLPSSSSCVTYQRSRGRVHLAGERKPCRFCHAIVDYQLSSSSSASSSLLVSVNDGSTWTSAVVSAPLRPVSDSKRQRREQARGRSAAGASEVQLCVQFAGTGGPTASIQQVHLDVDAIPATSPSFTSTSLANFTVGTAGSFSVSANGPPSPTITESGSLPSGVSFTGGTGSATLSGTPASGTSGTYPLTFTATNAIGSVQQNFTLSVDYAPSITSASSTTFTVGSAGTFTVATTGLPAPSLSQSTGNSQTGLPGWATFADNGNGTATLSGTPPTGSAGNYTFTDRGCERRGHSRPELHSHRGVTSVRRAELHICDPKRRDIELFESGHGDCHLHRPTARPDGQFLGRSRSRERFRRGSDEHLGRGDHCLGCRDDDLRSRGRCLAHEPVNSQRLKLDFEQVHSDRFRRHLEGRHDLHGHLRWEYLHHRRHRQLGRGLLSLAPALSTWSRPQVAAGVRQEGARAASVTRGAVPPPETNLSRSRAMAKLSSGNGRALDLPLSGSIWPVAAPRTFLYIPIHCC